MDKKGAPVGAKATKANVKKMQGAGNAGAANKPPDTEEQYVNSDEEVESVMQAIKLSRPAPVAVKPHYFVKRRRAAFRLRDVLLETLRPKSSMNHSESMSSVSSTLTGFGSTTSSNNNFSIASPSSSMPSIPTSNANILQQQQQQQLQLPQRVNFQPYSMAAMLANNARLNQPLPSTISTPQGTIGFSGSMDNTM